MRPENLKEIEKFCNDVKSQKPDITNDELKILLAEFMKKKQISVAEVIEQVKTTQKIACSACGTENEADVAFCTACGQKLESEEKSKPLDASVKVQENVLEVNTSDKQTSETEVASEAERGSLVCKQCGAVLDPGATFCTSCGAQTGDTEIKQKKYPFAGVICSYCDERIEIRQEVTVCPKCGEPHHAECWAANNYSCSLPDCDGREIETIEQVKTTQKKACSACGAENEADVVFCTACGQKLEPEEKSQPIETAAQVEENELAEHASDKQTSETEVASETKSDDAVCMQCGAVLDPGATFCTSCGAQTGNTEVKQKKYHFVGVICSYCEKAIEIRQKVTVCPKCGEPHHTECWVANNYSCSMPDCDGREITYDETATNLNQDGVASGSKGDIPNGAESGGAEPVKGEETRGTRGTPFMEKLRTISGKRGELGKHKIKVGIVAAIILILLPVWYVISSPYDIGTTPNEFRNRFNSTNHGGHGKIAEFVFVDFNGLKAFVQGANYFDVAGIINKDGKIRMLQVGGGGGRHIDELTSAMLDTILACSPELSHSDAQKLLGNLIQKNNDQLSKVTIVGSVRYSIGYAKNGDVCLFVSHKKENKDNILKELEGTSKGSKK